MLIDDNCNIQLERVVLHGAYNSCSHDYSTVHVQFFDRRRHEICHDHVYTSPKRRTYQYLLQSWGITQTVFTVQYSAVLLYLLWLTPTIEKMVSEVVRQNRNARTIQKHAPNALLLVLSTVDRSPNPMCETELSTLCFTATIFLLTPVS